MSRTLVSPNGTLWTVESDDGQLATLRRFTGKSTMSVSHEELDAANWRDA